MFIQLLLKPLSSVSLQGLCNNQFLFKENNLVLSQCFSHFLQLRISMHGILNLQKQISCKCKVLAPAQYYLPQPHVAASTEESRPRVTHSITHLLAACIHECGSVFWKVNITGAALQRLHQEEFTARMPRNITVGLRLLSTLSNMKNNCVTFHPEHQELFILRNIIYADETWKVLAFQ